MTLAASETKAVAATITTSEMSGDVSGSIRLFTDDVRYPEIKLAYLLRATASGARQAK